MSSIRADRQGRRPASGQARGQADRQGRGQADRQGRGQADRQGRGQADRQGRDQADGRARASTGAADYIAASGAEDSLVDVVGGVRLQKVLAAAGLGSRRHCEELIGEGRVEVDGQVVRRFGARVDPQHQVIRVDGRRLPAREDLVYVALNKPAAFSPRCRTAAGALPLPISLVIALSGCSMSAGSITTPRA